MPNLQTITCEDLYAKLPENKWILIDIRDPSAYLKSHLPKAQHVTILQLEQLSQGIDKAQAIVVYCYHGNSSQRAAQYLLEQGFRKVYSLIGGFSAWQEHYPDALETAN